MKYKDRLHGKRKRGRRKRICAAALALIMLCMTFSVSAADLWDGYVEEEAKDVVDLIDFNNAGTILASGMMPKDRHTADGNLYSGYWGNHGANQNIYLTEGIPRDWSEYERIEIKIYSDIASTGTAMFIVETEGPTADISYFSTKLAFDWEGWKTYSIPLSQFTQSRAADWSKVTRIRITVGGWNMIIADASVYFSSLKLLQGDGTSLGDIYTPETIQEAKDAMENAVAIYGGRPNAVKADGEVEQMGANTITINDTVLAPQVFFEDQLGAEVQTDSGSWRMTANGITVSGTEGSANYTVNNKENKFTAPVQDLNGQLYIPAAEAAAALGKNTVTDGKLVIIGSDDAIDLFERNFGVNEYTEIITYLAGHITVDPGTLTDEDCKAVKDNWRHYLVGSVEENDTSDPNIAAKLKTISDTGQSSRDRMIKSEGQTELFSGMNSTASSSMTSAYLRLNEMAMAYATPGCALYHDDSLKDDILYGLEWLNKNRYGQKEIDGVGWRSTEEYNWWDWDIGVPQSLVSILLVMEDHLTQEQISRYLKLFDLRVPGAEGEGSNAFETGRCAIGSALLQNDPKKVLKVEGQMDFLFLYEDNARSVGNQLQGDRAESKGQGFHTDGSYVFHTLHAMNATYGLGHFIGIAAFVPLFKGTAFEFTNPQTDNVADWIYNSFEPFIYDDAFFRLVEGRDPGDERKNAVSALEGMLSVINMLEPEDQARVRSIIKNQALRNSTDNVYADLDLYSLITLAKLMEDESVKPRENYKLNKVFYNEDKVMHQREDFAMGVSMSSSRIFNYESINSQNTTGWYVSDGMVEYRVKGDVTQSKPEYWKDIDPYRLAGTTIETQERKAATIAQGNEYLSSKDFVGGVSDGEYGAAAMWLESYHYDTDFGRENGSYGGKAPALDCDLEAKKSYFMFDDEVVCIGADIHADTDGHKNPDGDPSEVETVVDNRLAIQTKSYSEETANEPYIIRSVSADQTPEAENVAQNTIDGSLSTKWAAEEGAAITWDLGEDHELGFVVLSFQNGAARTQKFDLDVSSDGSSWTRTYSGSSSGKTELGEAFTLNNEDARYVRFVNHGNSAGSTWVSLTTAEIYPPNADGSVAAPAANLIGAETVTADGAVREIGADDVDLSNSKWVHLEGSGGYYFPNGGNLFARWYRKKSPFFELWLKHGKNPKDEKYAYVMLPGKTAEETEAYALNPDIEILENSEALQAVRENKLGITAIVFWEAGEYNGIAADSPMMVMLRDGENGEREVVVSDPTQKLKTGKVTIPGSCTAAECDIMMDVGASTNDTILKMNFEGSDGRSMKAKLIPNT